MTGLDTNGLPQSAEPALDANFVFAFVGEAQRPEIWSERNDGNDSEKDGNDELGGPREDRRVIASAVAESRVAEAESQAKTVKLNPGERLGWWSARKFDRRVRMRAVVNGAVNDKPTKILLDTGANISAVSVQFAKRLRLMKKARHDMEINVQGIGKSKVPTTARITVKVTLGWQIVYEFDVWIMDHHAGVDLILGTDFMIPAGIRLDLFNSTAKLPDEVVIPLLKSQSAEQCTPSDGSEVAGGPPESLTIPSRCTAEFRLSKRAPSTTTHELWIRRAKDWIPTAIHNSRGREVKVLVTNVSDRLIWCPAHFPVVVWIPHGELPADNGLSD